MYQDESIICIDCRSEFVFTAGEQRFYADKGFGSKPTRCAGCRQARKASRGVVHPVSKPTMTPRLERQMFPATCTACSKETSVPFKPAPGKPVYCRDCFVPRRAAL